MDKREDQPLLMFLPRLPACLTPLIYNGLFLVTLNAMTLFPNLRRLQARNVCLRCSRVSNRPCRTGYPVLLNPYTMLVYFVIHLRLTGGYVSTRRTKLLGIERF